MAKRARPPEGFGELWLWLSHWHWHHLLRNQPLHKPEDNVAYLRISTGCDDLLPNAGTDAVSISPTLRSRI